MPIFLLLATYAMGHAQRKSPVEVPKIALKIPLGQSVEITGGTTITFEEVVEDSRCPKDATCVWEGLAKVKLKVLLKGNAPHTKTVTIRGNGQPVIVQTGTNHIRALQLAPYPKTSNAHNRQYVLLVGNFLGIAEAP
ncbi:MAG: hypothetical protein ACPG7E_03915 [Marinirhabdus sp.]